MAYVLRSPTAPLRRRDGSYVRFSTDAPRASVPSALTPPAHRLDDLQLDAAMHFEVADFGCRDLLLSFRTRACHTLRPRPLHRPDVREVYCARAALEHSGIASCTSRTPPRMWAQAGAALERVL